jgi:hypothetical protein
MAMGTFTPSGGRGPKPFYNIVVGIEARGISALQLYCFAGCNIIFVQRGGGG